MVQRPCPRQGCVHAGVDRIDSRNGALSLHRSIPGGSLSSAVGGNGQPLLELGPIKAGLSLLPQTAQLLGLAR